MTAKRKGPTDSRPSLRLRVVFSAAFAIPCALRIGANEFIYGKGPGTSLWGVVISCRTVFAFLVSGLLAFAALSIGSKVVRVWEERFLRTVKRELKNVFTGYRFILLFLVISFVILLATGVPTGETLTDVLPKLVTIATDEVKSLKSIAAVLTFIFCLALINSIIKKVLRWMLEKYWNYRNKTTVRAFEEWQLSSAIFITAGAILLWTGGFTLSGISSEETASLARIGFYKDIFIFTFLGSTLINAMLRYREIMPSLSETGLKMTFALFAVVAVFLFTVLLCLDFHFITLGIRQSSEFPEQWQKHAVRIAMVIRDFIVWPAISISIFVMLIQRFLLALSKLNESKRSPQPNEREPEGKPDTEPPAVSEVAK